jgi:hypothetical protein
MTPKREMTAAVSLEARLAARLASGLSIRSQQLPHDITERLRFAREQAVGRARQIRLSPAPATAVVAVTAQGTAVFGGHRSWWQQAASVLPLVFLVCGLVAIDRWSVQEQVRAAADIDSMLLSDTLPPTAYSDPGFGEFLRAAPSP